MKKKNLNQKIAQVAKHMPPVSNHKDRSKEWTPEQSGILRTLIQDPKIANGLIDLARKSMVFDEKTKLWAGEMWNKKWEEAKASGFF